MDLSIIKQIVLLRKRALLCLAVVVIFAIAIQFFISLYQQPKLDRAKSEWMQQRVAAGRGAALMSREVIYRTGHDDFVKFRERIYPKKQFARFVGEIYDAVGRNRLEVSSISYKPEVNKDSNLLHYSLGIAVVGNYPQLKKFINDLDNSGNLLHIDSVSFSGLSNSSDVQLQIQLTAYFRMEEQ